MAEPDQKPVLLIHSPITKSKMSLSFAQAQDTKDPLSAFRDQFHIPKDEEGNEIIYLVGHSLGLQPKTVRDYVIQELDDWKTLGVEGHFKGRHPWMAYHEFLTEKLARLVGAGAEGRGLHGHVPVSRSIGCMGVASERGVRHRPERCTGAGRNRAQQRRA